eukprot:Nitzschia sp. Nitz4//scaffold57_size113557//33958//34375//NITZ4_003985-RA/size113557-augustus-gene-0.179-mRNA-1//-1//CDS//3329554828//3738//frame0
MGYFDRDEFEEKVSNALKAVERILEVDRNPRLAGNVDHTYDDKYALADSITNSAILAVLNALHEIGLTLEVLQSVDVSKPVTMRLNRQCLVPSLRSYCQETSFKTS